MLDTHHGVTTAAPQPAPRPASLASESQPDELDPLLDQARQQARERGLPYAGGVSPTEAWELVSAGHAVLVDVRTNEERKFVGHVPDSLHVAWMTGTALTRNPRFVKAERREWQGREYSIPVVVPPLGAVYFRFRPDMEGHV